MVNSLFEKQIGRSIEVYVDDMVIKSLSEEKLFDDIEETFKNLERVWLKLNPRKCTFGVEDGQLWEYYVTEEGIQSIPAKVKELMEVASPHT